MFQCLAVGLLEVAIIKVKSILMDTIGDADEDCLSPSAIEFTTGRGQKGMFPRGWDGRHDSSAPL